MIQHRIYNNKIFKNILWLLFDKIFILLLQFVVGVKIANHYGSDLYGIYAYAVAIISFSPVILELVNPRVIKMYYNDYDFEIIVSTVTFIKTVLAFFIFLLCIVACIFLDLEKSTMFFLITLSLNNIFLTTTYGIENYFEFKLETKYTVISNNIVKLFSYIIQYIFIISSFSIVFIPIVRCVGSFLRIFILRNYYSKKTEDYKISSIKNRINFHILKKIIVESRMLWLSVISFVIYSQIDSVMIGNILGKNEVGIYAIGMQLMTISSILILPFTNSVFPKLLVLYKNNLDEFENYYIKYSSMITYIYLLLIILSNIVVTNVFDYVFSKEYNQAIGVYFWLSISVFIKAHYSLRSSYLTIVNSTQIMLYGTIIGAFSNIILNFILIPRIGIIGAAISTIISPLIDIIVSGLLTPEGRKQLCLNLYSFNFIQFLIPNKT